MVNFPSKTLPSPRILPFPLSEPNPPSFLCSFAPQRNNRFSLDQLLVHSPGIKPLLSLIRVPALEETSVRQPRERQLLHMSQGPPLSHFGSSSLLLKACLFFFSDVVFFSLLIEHPLFFRVRRPPPPPEVGFLSSCPDEGPILPPPFPKAPSFRKIAVALSKWSFYFFP